MLLGLTLGAAALIQARSSLDIAAVDRACASKTIGPVGGLELVQGSLGRVRASWLLSHGCVRGLGHVHAALLLGEELGGSVAHLFRSDRCLVAILLSCYYVGRGDQLNICVRWRLVDLVAHVE